MSAHLPAGHALIDFDEIGSTNDEARQRAEAGETGPLWIRAASQSAGRGRQGRQWQSPPGNLMTTLLIAPGRPAAASARLSFASALSVHDLACAACPNAAVTLKWPNDVLVEGQKTAGILLESGGERQGVLPWLAVGIGVNLVSAPEDTPYPATALSRHGPWMSRDRALSLLARAWERWFGLWRTQGFAPLRDAWLARAAGLGGPMTARLQSESFTGVFEGLDGEGCLLLRLDDGTVRTVSAGDVFFGGS